MLVPIAFVLGFAFGWYRAGILGGDRKDKLQYGVAHAIAFTLLAAFAAILITRLGWV